jgi:hypothetical protein
MSPSAALNWELLLDRALADDPPCPAQNMVPAKSAASQTEQRLFNATPAVIPEEWSRALLALRDRPPPVGISPAKFAHRLDVLFRFAENHAADLADAGWSYAEAFRAGENWLRVADWGAAWFVRLPVARITHDAIELRTRTGLLRAYRNGGVA